jgi:predicted O-methyltransferase YrrM
VNRYAIAFAHVWLSVFKRLIPRPLQEWLLNRIVAETPLDPFLIEWLMSRVNREQYSWEHVRARVAAGGAISGPPETFADLLPLLFHVGPANRGVCQLDLDEAQALWALCRSMSGGVFVEIGRFKGGSTALMACACGAGGRLFSFDIDSQYDASCTAMLEALGVANRVELIVGDSRASNMSAMVVADLVFVDGGHSYKDVCADVEAWYPALKPDGVMCFHDAVLTRSNATRLSSAARAVQDILQSTKYEWQPVLEAGSLLAVRRKAPTGAVPR